MIAGEKLDKKNKTQNFVSAFFENFEIIIVIKCFVVIKLSSVLLISNSKHSSWMTLYLVVEWTMIGVEAELEKEFEGSFAR